MENVIYDTVIVGAGLAGVSAARTLYLNGIKNILVLEAQEQVGGRVRTEIVDNFPFDHGAQFVHKEFGDPLYDYAARNGLLLNLPSFKDEEGNFYTQCGIRVDPDAVDEGEKLVEMSLHHGGAALKEENIQEIFDSTKKEIHHDITTEGLLEWHKNYEIVDNPCHRLDELSAATWNQYQEHPGHYCHLVKGGFISIINHLLKAIPKSAVKCNEPVNKIIWADSNESSDVVVRASSGQEYHCNHVIITCPIGFLKEHWEDFFEPLLPAKRLAIFKSIGYGSMAKIVLMFEEPFWEAHCKGFQFAWTDTHLGHSQAYVEPWYHYLTGFDVVQASNPAILLGWVGSRGALYMANWDPSDDEMSAECVRLLEEFTGHPNIPKPFKVLRTRWRMNPFIQGAYSYRTAPFDPKMLEPLGRKIGVDTMPSLLFAGEAFESKHSSSAHGAFSSGRNQAMKIIEWKKKLLSSQN